MCICLLLKLAQRKAPFLTVESLCLRNSEAFHMREGKENERGGVKIPAPRRRSSVASGESPFPPALPVPAVIVADRVCCFYPFACGSSAEMCFRTWFPTPWRVLRTGGSTNSAARAPSGRSPLLPRFILPVSCSSGLPGAPTSRAGHEPPPPPPPSSLSHFALTRQGKLSFWLVR